MKKMTHHRRRGPPPFALGGLVGTFAFAGQPKGRWMTAHRHRCVRHGPKCNGPFFPWTSGGKGKAFQCDAAALRRRGETSILRAKIGFCNCHDPRLGRRGA